MKITTRLTAIFEKVGNDFIGYIEEIPGVNTQGATLEEAGINLQEACSSLNSTNANNLWHLRPRYGFHC